MKKQVILTSMLLTLFASAMACGQCKQEPEYKKYRMKAGHSGDQPAMQASYFACMKYYEITCYAQGDMDKINGKEVPRTQQAAYALEDRINQNIADYNSRPEKGCGTLEPMTVKYTDSIGAKTDQVVGYWITKDVINDQTYYPSYTFFNNGNFKLSYYRSDYQRSTWKEVAENTYEITEEIYSEYNKDFDPPKKSKFVIKPNGTATYHFTDYRDGREKTSEWVYKGKAYHMFGLSEQEILTPTPL